MGQSITISDGTVKPPRIAAKARAGLLPSLALAAAFFGACGPMVDAAKFPVRPDSVRPADLLGPYDGIVLDADTDRPVAGALVAASWAFERGIGMQAPLVSREVVVESGVDGRYAIPRLTDLPDADLPGGASTRLRRFTLVVYRRGHVGWRSDRRFGRGVAAARRRDFSQRGNRVRLEKWQPELRHADHLVFLGGGEKIRAAAAWELEPAALELESPGEAGQAQKVSVGQVEGAAATGRAAPLDIERLLSDDEIRGVTGFVGKFEDGKLTDLPTTEFYDSRHFKAVGKPEGFDVGLRVWRLGPAAAEAQYRKLLEELPGARSTDEIGDASLRARSGDINGLAFLVRERGVVASLTCGVAQCPEAAQILKLAKLVESRLPELPPEVPAEAPAPPAEAPGPPAEAPAPPGQGGTP